MPTLPLYVPTDVPDAWHQVLAPGGYEYWRFDAYDPSADLRFIAILGQGYEFDPAYWREYRRYRRRPTRWPPPVPGDHPDVRTVLIRQGRVVARSTAQPAARALVALCDRPSVSAGGIRFGAEADGTMALHVPRDAPDDLGTTLHFRPLVAAQPLVLSLARRDGVRHEHRWVIAAPFCQVTGEVVLPDGKTTGFQGHGFHDHCYGTAPLALSLSQWVWGRVFHASSSLGFFVAQARHADAHCARIVAADANGVRELKATRVDASWGRGFYDLHVELADGNTFELNGAKLMDEGAGSARFVCAAELGADVGMAACEALRPGRPVTR